MATNDFLPFAGGAGANVIDQPTYAALTAILANGFSSGTAQSAQLNKVWRQASILAAVVAQMLADTTGQNAVDDGTTATLLANFKLAVAASVPVNDTGTANAYIAALPTAPAALFDGMRVCIKAANANTGASTLNLNGLGAKSIVGSGNGALQGGEIVANARVLLIWNSTLNAWVIEMQSGGATPVAAGTQSNHAINLGQFTGSNQSLANPGYQRLPGGLIIQWATVNTNGSLTQTVTFPLAFPHAMLADAVVQPDGIIIAGQGATATTRTYTQRVGTGTGAAAGTGNSFNYIAVGW